MDLSSLNFIQPLPSEVKKLTVFDLDKTILRKTSVFWFFMSLYQKGVFSHQALFYALFYGFLHRCGLMCPHMFQEKIFKRILLKKSLPLIEGYADGFAQIFLKNYSNPSVCQELFAAQKRGDFTLILSGSPSFLVKYFAKYLSVNAWKSTEYKTDKDGFMTGIGFFMDGKLKSDFMMHFARRFNICKQNITIYSDSIHDLPMFLQGGDCVAVNPDNRLLLVARRLKWRVLLTT